MSIFEILFYIAIPMATTKKKTVAKKTSAAPKKTVTKKTVTKKTEAKKTVSKKEPVAKKTTVKTAPRAKKSVSKKATVAPKKKTIPTIVVPALKKEKVPTMSIFSIILAVFVVALVVFGGYVYSQIGRDSSSDVPQSEQRQMSVSSAVMLSPEVMSTLEALATQISIGPDEVLLSVEKIGDIALVKS